MKKLIVSMLIAVIAVATPVDANAGLLKKKKPTKIEAPVLPAKKKQTSWEKLFKDKKVITSKSSFINLHRVGDNLYFELPLQYINREMLLASTLSEVTMPDISDIGYKKNSPLHVKFTQTDSIIHLRQIMTTSATTDNGIQKAIDKVYGNPILYSYPVARTVRRW
jgi:hypothetical protein